ncbi:MAG TPA: alpha/beta fold hydrolase [Myxococcota bacterium]
MRRSAATAFVVLAALAGLAALLRVEPTPPPPDARGVEDVVLLHGLGRTDRAMRPLEDALVAAGYRVHNLAYPSLALEPAQLVALVGDQIDACCARAEKLHFVTHSLGGLLARATLAQRPRANLGRVVMLAPPNNGSEYGDLAREAGLDATQLAPAIAALGTDPASFARTLPPPRYELGVIAGTRTVNPLDPLVVRGASDGAVSVASTRLPGMTDFLSVDATHSSIRRKPEVHAQVIAFLRNGHFEHTAGPLRAGALGP